MLKVVLDAVVDIWDLVNVKLPICHLQILHTATMTERDGEGKERRGGEERRRAEERRAEERRKREEKGRGEEWREEKWEHKAIPS